MDSLKQLVNFESGEAIAVTLAKGSIVIQIPNFSGYSHNGLDGGKEFRVILNTHNKPINLVTDVARPDAFGSDRSSTHLSCHCSLYRSYLGTIQSGGKQPCTEDFPIHFA